MKATGIVRRVEECVIRGQKLKKRINTRVLLIFGQLNSHKMEHIHSNSAVSFTALLLHPLSR